jgi:hypothetical protein
MNLLEKYGNEFKTDKITHHKYHEIFPMFIEQFTEKNGSIIEIGLEREASLKMWLHYFKNMHIYGLDIKLEKTGERFTIFKGDQSSENDLDNFTKIIKKPVYFINDDGSHIPEHQLLTFNKLFPILEENGVYIIEDIETSYWTKNGLYGYKTNYGYKHPKSIVELFKNVIDCVNNEFMLKTIATPIKHLDMIKSITFAYNCIIIVKHKSIKRNYRFKNNL